ncbi:MAG: alpha/beta hydrolase [Oscillospiraceae bacterium]|jgi:pimeloyl-ACP methyl ester carboxylesterase|nr:alpha/beta hydrolase [Oscillospiraceae bacterium]
MTITIGNQSVFYGEQGEGPAILLLHGWGADGALFAPLTGLLARKYRVLALDFPGFGHSPEPPAPWDVDGYADLVLGFLDALGIGECALLGHSFGGRVIIKLCARQLEAPRFTKAILVGAAGVRHGQGKKSSGRAKRYRLAKKILKPFPKLLERARNHYGSADYRAASPLMRQVLVNTVNEDLSGLLPLIRQETLLIWGRGDDQTPLSDGQLMENTIPNAGLVILENAGHYAFLERQEQFLRVMASFMQIT